MFRDEKLEFYFKIFLRLKMDVCLYYKLKLLFFLNLCKILYKIFFFRFININVICSKIDKLRSDGYWMFNYLEY